MGAWLLWGLLCLATAVALPGVSVIFLVPLLASVVFYAFAVFTPLWRSVWAAPLAASMAALVTAYLWLPFAISLESGLGLEFAAAIAVLDFEDIPWAAIEEKTAWMHAFETPKSRGLKE